jgi:DNA-binding CsgD family transcriptional regulator
VFPLLHESALRLVSDAAAICAEFQSPTEAGSALLNRLADSIHFDAAALSCVDPVLGGHRTVVATNYPKHVLDYLNRGFVNDDPAYLMMRFRDRSPLRWCDVPQYEHGFSAREVFIPSGYREGVTTCLFTRDGRYTGALHLSFSMGIATSDAAKACLTALQSVIAPVIDALRPTGVEAWQPYLESAIEGGFYLTTGHYSKIAGLPQGPITAPGGPVDEAMRSSKPGRRLPHRFWMSDPRGGSVLVRLVQVAGGHIVLVHREPVPFGLSPRELEVLALVAFGLSNQHIAARLGLTTRTVATHVEHLLSKLRMPSRAAAVAVACQEGLVPPGSYSVAGARIEQPLQVAN